MGFTGLNCWQESDNAADFKWVLEKALWKIAAKNKTIKTLITKELETETNCYNTPGVINVALLVKDDIIPMSVLTKAQKEFIVKRIDEYLKGWDKHHDEDLRALKIVFKKVKKKKK